jgi:hypothetical protein
MSQFEPIHKAFEQGRQLEERYSASPIVWWVEETADSLEQAFQEAAVAVAAAERLDWPTALRHARRACQIEAEEFGKCRWWRPLRHAIRAARRTAARQESITKKGA